MRTTSIGVDPPQDRQTECPRISSSGCRRHQWGASPETTTSCAVCRAQKMQCRGLSGQQRVLPFMGGRLAPASGLPWTNRADGGGTPRRHEADTWRCDDADVSRRARLVSAAALVVAAFAWLLLNGPVEGPVLWQFSSSHGVTVADLGSVAAVLLAAVLVIGPEGRRSP